MFSILLSLFLAGRVFAFTFNVTVTPALATLAPLQLLNFSFTGAIDSCQSLCNDASTAFANCTASSQAATPAPDPTPDPASDCLCANSTVVALVSCEQCIFSAQIAANLRPNDPRAGSQPLLTAYSASCAAANINLTTSQTALTLPANWDGPSGIHLSVAGTVFTVMAATGLGGSAMWMLSNL
ncbi:uncharacterized protein BT62DRAFT_1004866 [Guyanagaster necrorhizus]|uniref:Uncharacterized protein n=1 Tax=Guyanagaster necrorhizus TaxID=856835 RepID=A0A9P8ATC2_9AGAR|nr:uncharacterized protein BT62DRAFT_1004866 [Guyanagaster necrorhizus MCA 3950]KAG7447288.1 hypothetical protein BT62DRAFT_1004866 [Guyanagaster necrorhizus MCA 3950]